MAEQTMCMNCGTSPAIAGGGTVPLCSKCGRLASGKERGVKMAPPPKKARDKKPSLVR